ncbi:PREDICTED: F-BAR domain only protein 1 [Corvus brachyrhynchos]|uniref:F-BAR domain only protein 1 n=1 Tax=Corvus brachyrhynchos TaxID=85066 RepID=UPI00081677C3|nr:PREDICTED: F-BAR domain only protein 1 [Corvus brachyrhynchos]
MKHGQISTKELADFVRERAAIEENYAKAMVKLSKMATNGTQLGTFAPLWEVFRISSDKLALCHLELMKKLHDLIKEISRYGEEQGRVHKKSKEEVSGTLEAVQLLHGVAQLLPKSKESYHSKCQEYERLRKEGPSQKEIDKAELKSRKAGEALRRAVDKYNAARADFEQRMLDSAMVGTAGIWALLGGAGMGTEGIWEGVGTEGIWEGVGTDGIWEGMGTWGHATLLGDMPAWLSAIPWGCCPLGMCHPDCAKPWGHYSHIPQFPHPHIPRPFPAPAPDSPPSFPRESPDNDLGCPEVDEDGFTVRPDIARSEAENPGCSSSDSDYDEDEPRKFYVHIKPVQPREASGSAEATVEQLKATVGNLILAPGVGGTVRRQASRHAASLTPASGDTDPEGTLPAGGSVGRGLPAAPVDRYGAGGGEPGGEAAPLEAAGRARCPGAGR